ncbi:NAD-dependent succinate-semialdehyde dehydrogenase [Microbulbifer pacificus]|uniref:NAD-dependent succinate-semialdehyde dehydrogenase n=1 Tax=Microbulbifer pacificus TaxID=407164 RepID=A0AAU0N3F2_9GAMM|nr:NAD-dependent succinate-semialdehyde dehydrogenase [Microbulbifer pacificus]WOX07038.1 NAD-dependent succinate-semialdehyde dehydrogenase [Microbulbifer pacificus]
MHKLLNTPLLRKESYIGGEWWRGESTLAVHCPATGETIETVWDFDREAATAAVRSAELALPMWRDKTAKERAHILRTWHDEIIRHTEELALILTAEQGKPLAEARAEILYGASYIEWFAEEAKRIYGDVIAPPNNDRRVLVLKQPVGVVAAITPWNFPSAMLARKLAPALAAGCTFVCKPAAETPLSALALAVLAEKAGVPAGVFNVVVSSRAREVGEVFTGDAAVRKLSFTGSTPVGKLLAAQCAQTVKKVSLELGGNAPFIVFDDADIDRAVAGAIASKYRNAGQTCICTNRILVQDAVYDKFIEKYCARVAELKIGSGFEDGVDLGPMITADAVGKVARLVGEACAAGGRILIGGKRGNGNGNFYLPTVLEVAAESPICREEIFGPVSPVIRFVNDQEAVSIANDTPYGLAAYMYSRDLGRIWRVAEQLEYGMVGINESGISNEMAPFGGVKESGIGREGSKYGLDDYLETKYLCMGIS